MSPDSCPCESGGGGLVVLSASSVSWRVSALWELAPCLLFQRIGSLNFVSCLEPQGNLGLWIRANDDTFFYFTFFCLSLDVENTWKDLHLEIGVVVTVSLKEWLSPGVSIALPMGHLVVSGNLGLSQLGKGMLRPASCWISYRRQDGPHHREQANLKCQLWGFPGGTVVKNPPANAGDTGSSPGPGRSHMLQSN